MLCCYKAVNGPASLVVPIDKRSIFVPILVSFQLFREKLKRRATAVLTLIVAGTLIVLIN